jgi:hypothetical protein
MMEVAVWTNEVTNLVPEMEGVIQEMLEADATGYRVCFTDYQMMLFHSIALNTLNKMPKPIHTILRKRYGDDESIVREMRNRLRNRVSIKRSGAKGKVTIRLKGDKLYKLRILVDIPRKLLHDKYVEFFEKYVCGDETEWCYCREEGEIVDHEVFLTKKELRKYKRICEIECPDFIPY